MILLFNATYTKYQIEKQLQKQYLKKRMQKLVIEIKKVKV